MPSKGWKKKLFQKPGPAAFVEIFNEGRLSWNFCSSEVAKFVAPLLLLLFLSFFSFFFPPFLTCFVSSLENLKLALTLLSFPFLLPPLSSLKCEPLFAPKCQGGSLTAFDIKICGVGRERERERCYSSCPFPPLRRKERGQSSGFRRRRCSFLSFPFLLLPPPHPSLSLESDALALVAPALVQAAAASIAAARNFIPSFALRLFFLSFFALKFSTTKKNSLSLNSFPLPRVHPDSLRHAPKPICFQQLRQPLLYSGDQRGTVVS